MLMQLPKAIDLGNPVNYRSPVNRGLFAWWTTLPGMKKAGRAKDGTTYNSSHVLPDLCKATAVGNTTATSDSAIHRPGGFGSMYHQAGYGSYGTLKKPWISTGGYALAFWARPNYLAANQYLANFSTGNVLAIILGFQANSWNIFEGSYASGGSTTITAINDTWQHVVYTRDASRVQGYLNGVLKVDVTHSWGSPAAISAVNLNNALSYGPQPFYGHSDDIRLYRRSLTANDVAALFKASRTGYKKELNWLDRPFVLSAASATIGVLEGTAALTFTGSAAIVGQGVVAGATTVTFSAAGGVTGFGVIAGATSITLAASGAIVGVGVIAGAAAVAFAGSGEAIGVGVVAGAVTVTFAAAGSISAPVEIEGTAGISFTGSGEITGVGVMAASSAITLSSSGEISGVGVIAGTAAITFTQSAEITGLGTLEGTAAVTFEGSGDLVGIGELAAESTITLGASATIVGVGLVEGAATITFAASGSLDAPFVAWCVATGKESAKYEMVWIATATLYTLELPAATAKYVLAWAGDCTMSCVCDTDKLTNVFKNARTFATVTATVAASGDTTNSPTFTWTLKTRDGVTTLGTGTLTNTNAGGIYSLEIPLAVGALTTINVKYLLIIASSANEYEKQMEVLAINN